MLAARCIEIEMYDVLALALRTRDVTIFGAFLCDKNRTISPMTLAPQSHMDIRQQMGDPFPSSHASIIALTVEHRGGYHDRA